MPYPNEHSARINSPDKYEKMRRENDKMGAGVHVIWGILPGGKTEVQALRFDKSKFTPEEAKDWLKKHDYTVASFEPASRETKASEFRWFDEIAYLFSEKYPARIQILRTGSWNHPSYGAFQVTLNDLQQFKDNFDKKVRRTDIFLDVEHMPEKGSVAKFKDLVIEGNALYAVVDWTDWGKEVLDKKMFSYISPEFSSEWEDPESGETHINVLFGAALTNRPFIKGMEPVLLSEKVNFRTDSLPIYMHLTEGGSMLEMMLEMLGLPKNATIEQVKAKMEAMKAGNGKKMTEVFKALELKEDVEESEVLKKLNEMIEKSKQKEGTVSLSEAEVKKLKEDAEAGKKASDQLKLSEATAAVEKALVAGKIIPAQRDWAMKQAQADLKSFNEFVTAAPKVINTDENGSEAGAGLRKASEEIEAKVKELMEKNKTMAYAEAVKKALADDAELSKRYNEERQK